MSREAHDAFVAEHRAEWEALDARGEALTVAKASISEFTVVEGS